MNKFKVKVTVIGAGNMGINHARVFNSLGCLENIVESNPERRKFLLKKYGKDKIKKSIDETNSDAYIIATPTISHFQIASSLLNKNKHILIEKPVCMSIEEGEKLLEISKNKNCKIAVGHVERFNPIVDYLCDWIKEKELKTLETYRLSSLPQQVKDIGVFKDLGIHDVDVVLSLIKSEIESVYALSSKKNNQDLYTKASINFKNGVIAFITTSWLSTSKTRKIYVCTDREDAEMDYLNQSFETKKIKIPEGSPFQPQSFHNIQKLELKKEEPLVRQAENFLNSIENNMQPRVDLNQGIKALKVVEYVLLSVKEKKVIKF